MAGSHRVTGKRSGRSRPLRVSRWCCYSIVTVPLLTAATDSFRPFAVGDGFSNVQVTPNGVAPSDAPQSAQSAVRAAALQRDLHSVAALSGRT